MGITDDPLHDRVVFGLDREAADDHRFSSSGM